MGLNRAMRDAAGDPIIGAFSKTNTSADVFRLNVREPGKSESKILTGTFPQTVSLGFSYQVGEHQLEVYMLDTTTGSCVRLFDIDAWSSISLTPQRYFVELSDSTVEIHNTVGGSTALIFYIPHTSLPGEFSAGITVAQQGDNIGIKLNGYGDGILLTSSGGKAFLLRVDDDGNTILQEII